MLMKRHMLAALREELALWEARLATMSEAQLTAARAPSGWSVKDELAHLWGWQQRTVAHVEAALHDRAPVFPPWPAELDPEVEDVTQINDWLYESARALPWPEVYARWRAGFLRLLELAEQVSERDLLDSTRYAWLAGYPLVNALLGTYDHHQEHLEGLSA